MAVAELTDVRCHYDILGNAEPLLLIHGLGVTCRSWEAVATELAGDFSLIMPDNRGVGRSLPKRPPRTLSDLTSDLVELLDHLQIERAHVMGISLGGIIAQKLAIDHPSRIDRLALVSCTHEFTPYLRRIIGLLGQVLRKFPAEMFARTFELLGASPQFVDADPERFESRIRTKCGPTVSRAALGRHLRCLCSEEGKDNQGQIAAPTLVIAGEYDALIPWCYSRHMACSIPNSRFVLVRNAGHNPLAECPERVIPTITQFLKPKQIGMEDPGHGANGNGVKGPDEPETEYL